MSRREISKFVTLARPIVLMATLVAGCRAELATTDTELKGEPGGAKATTQLLSDAKLQKYKAALPKVAYPALQAILESSATLWYDKEVMIPVYQDSVGDGSYTPIGARFNSEGKNLIVPQGKRLFSDDGKTWAYPFAHTAGMDAADNMEVVNFLSLPQGSDGALSPIVYWTADDNNALGGLGLHRWVWMYPKGTVIGEMIFVKDAGGNLYPSELRTRTRYLDGWATNSFRPFPTATSLAAAIKSARPSWSSNSLLKGGVAALESNSTLVAKSVKSPAFNDVFTASGAIDTLPDFGDEALIKELLTKTAFVSSYGETWKTNGNLKAYAANASQFSIVPRNNDSGLIEVSEASCSRCHQEAGRSINDFEPQAILYGDIWGEDRIFSFHPYDQTKIGGAGDENRGVRPEFEASGLVTRYDASKHPADLYKKIAGSP